MLQHASMLSKKEQLPLLGIASCYSAIPLIYAAYRLKEPLGGVVLINAVLKLRPGAVFRSFWGHYRKMIPANIGIKKTLAAIGHYAEIV